MRRHQHLTTPACAGGLASFLGLSACAAPRAPDITPNAVVPSAEELAYQKMEFVGIVHFTVNTFADKE